MVVVFLGWHTGDVFGTQSATFPDGGSSALHVAAPIKSAAGMPAQPKNIIVWIRDDENSDEYKVIKKSAEIFNNSQHAYRAEVTTFFRKDYDNLSSG